MIHIIFQQIIRKEIFMKKKTYYDHLFVWMWVKKTDPPKKMKRQLKEQEKNKQTSYSDQSGKRTHTNKHYRNTSEQFSVM